MKRILILVLPLVLFAGFLAIKPPAIGADAKPTGSITPQANQDPTSPLTGNPATPTAKPSISAGGEEDDDDNKNGREKPRYGGHDDDDYDD
jgi:hypothetical protein